MMNAGWRRSGLRQSEGVLPFFSLKMIMIGWDQVRLLPSPRPPVGRRPSKGSRPGAFAPGPKPSEVRGLHAHGSISATISTSSPSISSAACAKSPEKIAAVEVGADAYARYSCSQLRPEKVKITQDLENLSAKQKDAASGDALGVFLLGLPISSMSGNDQEATIAIAKGKLQALDRQLQAKRCG